MKTFEDIDLIEPIHRALEKDGYETPTPIQAKTIPPALKGFDVLGCAQTGTGKTAAFALPILNQLGSEHRKSVPGRPRVLVLAPTRELAIQIDTSFGNYGRNLKLRRALVYGGVHQSKQVRALERGVHILVATPGRLLDLMSQGHIHLDHVEVFVLDEADRMLDMGFLPDLKKLIALLPEDRQSLFFSATLPSNVIALSKQLLTDPATVNVTPKTKSLHNIRQEVVVLERAEKQSRLQDFLNDEDVGRMIVFTRTKRSADTVARKLSQRGIDAGVIHGNKSQNARQRVLTAFRRGRVKVLVATDVAARGIDIDGVTHVVNFDVPTEPETYVHRIGRTGRAGAEGVAVTFCSPDQRGDLRAIENLIGKKLLDGPDPQHPGRPRHKKHGSGRKTHGSRHKTQGGGRKTYGKRSRPAAGSDQEPTGTRRKRKPSRRRNSSTNGSSRTSKPRKRPQPA